MVFIIIKATAGTYHLYQNPGMWPKAKAEMHTSEQRVFSHLELKSKCQKQSLGQDVVWTCLL